MNYGEEATGTRLHDIVDLQGKSQYAARFGEGRSRTLVVPPEVYQAMFDEIRPADPSVASKPAAAPSLEDDDSEGRTGVKVDIDVELEAKPETEAPLALKPRRWAHTIPMKAVDPIELGLRPTIAAPMPADAPSSAAPSVDPITAPKAIVVEETKVSPQSVYEPRPAPPVSVRHMLDEISMVMPAMYSHEWVMNASEEELARAIAELRKAEGIDHVLPPAHLPVQAPESQRTRLYTPVPPAMSAAPALSPAPAPWPPQPEARAALPLPPPRPYVQGPVEGWYPPHKPSAPPPARAKNTGKIAFMMLSVLVLVLGLGVFAAAKMHGPRLGGADPQATSQTTL